MEDMETECVDTTTAQYAGGGGGTQITNGYPLPNVAQSGSSEHQNIGAINSFEGKNRGRSSKNQIRVVTCKMCVFSI